MSPPASPTTSRAVAVGLALVVSAVALVGLLIVAVTLSLAFGRTGLIGFGSILALGVAALAHRAPRSNGCCRAS